MKLTRERSQFLSAPAKLLSAPTKKFVILRDAKRPEGPLLLFVFLCVLCFSAVVSAVGVLFCGKDPSSLLIVTHKLPPGASPCR